MYRSADFIADYHSAGRIAERREQEVMDALGCYLAAASARDQVWAVRIIATARTAQDEARVDRIARVAALVSTDTDRRRWLVRLVTQHASGTPADTALLLSKLWWFHAGFENLTSADVFAVFRRYPSARGRAAGLAIRAGLNPCSSHDDERRALRKALDAAQNPETARADADLGVRLELTRQLANMGQAFADAVAGVVIAARASNQKQLEDAWDALLPVKERQSIAREWFERFAIAWADASSAERSLLAASSLEMLRALDPAFDQLRASDYRNALDAMGPLQGPPGTLARLAVSASAIGFRQGPGEPLKSAVDRAKRQLLRAAPPRR